MTELVAQAEQTFVENPFGTVTSKRVIYYRAKGWFSGGSREDIPLQHVTSVRLDITRSVAVGIILLVIGLALLAAEGGLKIIGLLVLVPAVLMLWGAPAR